MDEQMAMPDQAQQNITEQERINVERDKINSELFKLKLETDPTLVRIEENWRNIVWDENANGGEGDYVQIKNTVPIMNDKGINTIMRVLKDIIHKEIIQSKLNEDFVARATYDIVIDVRNILFKNYKTYGITDTTLMTSIVNDCGLLIYSTLMRAEAGGERTSLRGNEVREVFSQVNTEGNKRNMNPMNLFGKGG